MNCKDNIKINELASEDLWSLLMKIRSEHSMLPEASIRDSEIRQFLEFDQNLKSAISQASQIFPKLKQEFPEIYNLKTEVLCQKLHSYVQNFYDSTGVPPFVPLAAQGPWIVTIQGGVIYDVGAYGMLGAGHNPLSLKKVLCREQVMANVKTASFSQYRASNILRQKIRAGDCPYEKFMFVNSGSEAVCVAARIADANALEQTKAGSRHAGKQIKYLSLTGSFHGRTQRSAMASHSTWQTYQSLASFKDNDYLVTVEPNNIPDLEEAFKKAEKENIFFEALFLEPVMGEGRAGFAITPDFYLAASKLITQHGGVLVVDSIQAGLRTHGVLSILDYPGFEKMPAPDLETFSKALNAGQYPLSVLALNARACQLYRLGTYGNTMTANPRALDIATTILNEHSDQVKNNICTQGSYALEKMLQLKAKYPEQIREVLGTGLLFSLQLSTKIPVEGLAGIEKMIRLAGVNVIHSSGNRLRFTPWFSVSRAELDLCFQTVEDCLLRMIAI